MAAMGLLGFHVPPPHCPHHMDLPLSSSSSLPSSSSPLRSFPGFFRLRGGMIKMKKIIRRNGNAIFCASDPRSLSKDTAAVKENSVSVILLAGGIGKRMGASMPKQYLPLVGQPIALYSFLTFTRMSEVKEIIVVCDPSYKDVFEDVLESHVKIKFALPGKERQDSVFNGFQEIDRDAKLVCIHDSARPLVLAEDIRKLSSAPNRLMCHVRIEPA